MWHYFLHAVLLLLVVFFTLDNKHLQRLLEVYEAEIDNLKNQIRERDYHVQRVEQAIFKRGRL